MPDHCFQRLIITIDMPMMRDTKSLVRSCTTIYEYYSFCEAHELDCVSCRAQEPRPYFCLLRAQGVVEEYRSCLLAMTSSFGIMNLVRHHGTFGSISHNILIYPSTKCNLLFPQFQPSFAGEEKKTPKTNPLLGELDGRTGQGE
jgi:hypothetical protein